MSVRATRLTFKGDKPSKKRKRNSNTENGDSPPAKHARTDGKEESSPLPEPQVEGSKEVELPSSGDVPIQDADATNILDVLELCVRCLSEISPLSIPLYLNFLSSRPLTRGRVYSVLIKLELVRSDIPSLPCQCTRLSSDPNTSAPA